MITTNEALDFIFTSMFSWSFGAYALVTGNVALGAFCSVLFIRNLKRVMDDETT